MRRLIALLVIVLFLASCSRTQTSGNVILEYPQEGETVKEKESTVVPEPVEKTEEVQEKNLTPINKTSDKKKEVIVRIKYNEFDPKEITIKKGTTVTWIHDDEIRDDEAHLLYGHGNEFRSPRMVYGEKFSHTFNESGRYVYVDLLYKEDYRGEVIVQ